MALTIAQVSHPNSASTEFPFGPFKARILDITFDSSYDNTNGESLTAASLGWATIEGAFVLADAWSGTATDLTAVIRPVATAGGSSIVFRAFEYNGAAAGLARLQEVADTTDLSTYTMRVCVFGS